MDNIKLDKWDLLIASGSGALTAALDVLLIKDISLKDAHADGSKWAENLVIKVAKSKKFMGKDDDLPGAVKHDLRDWDPEHEKMGKGVTLTEEEARCLYEILKGIFE